MLQDPFKTTRKVKVPMHSRVGHREHAFRTFAKFVLTVCAILLLLLLFGSLIFR